MDPHHLRFKLKDPHNLKFKLKDPHHLELIFWITSLGSFKPLRPK